MVRPTGTIKAPLGEMPEDIRVTTNEQGEVLLIIPLFSVYWRVLQAEGQPALDAVILPPTHARGLGLELIKQSMVAMGTPKTPQRIKGGAPGSAWQKRKKPVRKRKDKVME